MTLLDPSDLTHDEAFTHDITIIGGCGHVGFPLGLAFAERGQRVLLHDLDERSVDLVNAGRVPSDEPGAAEVLLPVVGDRLVATTDPTAISSSAHVIVVIGTPVGGHMGPDPQAVPRALRDVAGHFRPGQLLILRSTVFPGVTAQVERLVEHEMPGVDVAFCPERIAQGRAMTELYELPQLVAARTPEVVARAGELFSKLSPKVVALSPEEAELAKLFTNVWRYIMFAAANQLYVIANDCGLDYERIRSALVDGYDRSASLPKAGFAAGPCLLKDTMQLAEFDSNNFTLGHASMAINEGLPHYVVSRIEKRYHLEFMTVGVLGMAFKSESDDTRSSLSYRLKRILEFKAERVLCTDPYVMTDPSLVPIETVLEEADLLIIATPHERYRALRTRKPIVDIWNALGDGVRV